MKIGIIGAGLIGRTLVRKLAMAGHDVKVANSRGPETIDAELLSSGARVVTADEAVADIEVVILSIPIRRIPQVAPLLANLPDETVVIDTSNYYPHGERIEAIEEGQVESLWDAEQLGRPVVKAWNAITHASLARKGKEAGAPGRIAIPVAADREYDRQVAMALVRDTGLDAFDAGTLADSWRQQPGAPAYCTDLTLEEVGPALAAADRKRLPKRRDLALAVMMERMDGDPTKLDEEWSIRVVRAISM